MLSLPSGIEQLERQAPGSPEGKAMQLLEAIARRVPHPGDETTLTHEIDYPLAYATGGKELRSYLDHLKKREWIEVKQADESATICTLKVEGLIASGQKEVTEPEGVAGESPS
jgi:hypothetical protein